MASAGPRREFKAEFTPRKVGTARVQQWQRRTASRALTKASPCTFLFGKCSALILFQCQSCFAKANKLFYLVKENCSKTCKSSFLEGGGGGPPIAINMRTALEMFSFAGRNSLSQSFDRVWSGGCRRCNAGSSQLCVRLLPKSKMAVSKKPFLTAAPPGGNGPRFLLNLPSTEEPCCR